MNNFFEFYKSLFKEEEKIMAKVTEKDVGRTVEVDGDVDGQVFKNVKGVVRQITQGIPTIAVEFFEEASRYHRCDGLFGSHKGYFVYPENITFIDEFKPEYFSALNAKDARRLIGKDVEVSDDPVFGWTPHILIGVDEDVPCFEVEDDYFEYIRTVPEKPKENELLPFLEKTVAQWMIMALLGKSKEEAYFMVDPKGVNREKTFCFLCDKAFGFGCSKCLKWDSVQNKRQRPCVTPGSEYRKWFDNKTLENAQQVADYLKSELDKMKAERR